MSKKQSWFKKHIHSEVFSFMGFIFAIFAFSYNIVTNSIVPSQYLSLSVEETQTITPETFYLRFVVFSVSMFAIACVFLYYTIKKIGERK